MAAAGEKREEAERLYVRGTSSCPSIAEQLGVSPGTVYRWKSDAAEKGEASDWDTQRRVFHMSPRELIAIYAECFKSWVLKLKETPELLADPKIADAIAKHASVLLKLDPKGQYIGVALDLVEVINAWLDENEPELKVLMDGCWERILESLHGYFDKEKGLLE